MRADSPSIVVAAGLLAACSTPPILPDASEPSLVRVTDCDDLRDYAAHVMVETALDQTYGQYGQEVGEIAVFSPATVDRVGVPVLDHLDIVQVVDDYVFVAQGQAFHVVRALPFAQADKLATVEMDGWISGLILQGDTVAVVHYPSVGNDAQRRSWASRVTVFDVSDRSAPTVVQQVDVDGWVADVGVVGSQVYLAVNHELRVPDAAFDLVAQADLPKVLRGTNESIEGYKREAEQARADARSALYSDIRRLADDVPMTDLLPSWRIDGGDPVPMYPGCDLLRPTGAAQHGAMSIVSLDFNTTAIQTTGILSTGLQPRFGGSDLYLAQASHWRWFGGQQPVIETHLHRFELDGEVSYAASGEVRGWAYERGGLSEHEGRLRVVTSDADWARLWGETALQGSSTLSVVEDGGQGPLSVVGELSDIEPGTPIETVRPFGDLMYLAPAWSTGPGGLFDLSDPTNPVMGGLVEIQATEITLQRMDDDHLLAVSLPGDRFLYSILDISDPGVPTVAHRLDVQPEFDESRVSAPTWDPRAFGLAQGRLTTPYASDKQHDLWEPNTDFSGALTLEASVTTGFSMIGKVDHRPLVDQSECLYGKWYGYGASSCLTDFWYASVRRSWHTDDALFTLSDYGLRITDADEPDVERAQVLFFPK